MRQDCRMEKEMRLVNVQGYHSSTNQDGVRTSSARSLTSPTGAAVSSEENYAFSGFRDNYYINSDRLEKLDENYQRASGHSMKGWGYEFEMMCSSMEKDTILAEILDKVVFPNFKHGRVQFKLQRDSSLRQPGYKSAVEAITQVMTTSRVRNDYASYQVMFRYFRELGINMNTFETPCGMHINISNALFGEKREQQQEAIRKFYYIINKHYDFMLKVFYRDPDRTYFCRQQDASIARRIRLEGNTIGQNHCLPAAVNLSHYDAGRVELRIPGGQDNFYRFRNTVESAFHLVERCKRLSWADCDDIMKIFTGCNQYVIKRLDDCPLTPEQRTELERACRTVDLDLTDA